MKACCFTGHRIIKITPDLIQRLKDTIEDMIRKGVTDFYNGGACGWDLLCAEKVIDLRKEYPDIKLHLLLPCPPYEQSMRWNKAQIERYNNVLQAADSVTVISEHYSNDCMKRRNKRLVELSDCCICYCRNFRSGTGQTIRFAKEKGIDIINLFSG